jgi:hypothetical protein
MKKLIFMIGIVLATTIVGMIPTVATAASDCDKTSLSTRCGQVTDREYGGGTSTPNVVPITACLSERMFDSTKLRNGTSAWEVGFYYKTGEPEEVATVRNSRCWTEYRPGVRQHGNPGSYVVAFIACEFYTGWVGGVIPPNGRVNLKPIRLPVRHDPLESCRAADWDRTAEYKQCSLLK